MDYYPQPRPVLYGTLAEEAPPQTQTKPVRMEPPRWPPAPPLAGDFGDNSDEPSRYPAAVENDYAAFLGAGRGRFVVAGLYAAASLYALVTTLFMHDVFSGKPLAAQLFYLFQIAAAFYMVPAIVDINRRGHGALAVVAVVQLLLAIAAGAWLSAGSIVAVVLLVYLFALPSPASFKEKKPDDVYRYARTRRATRWRHRYKW